MKNRTLFIGLLAMSAFLGACTFSVLVMVNKIPPFYFEENRGEDERLVYVTLERGDYDEREGGGYSLDDEAAKAQAEARRLAEASLYIVTDNAAIENLTAPYIGSSSIGSSLGLKKFSPSIYNSISIRSQGLAVFSLPKSQDTIGFAYFCSFPTRMSQSSGGGGGVSMSMTTVDEMVYSNGRATYKIDPEADDIAIKVRLIPSNDPAFKTAMPNNNFKQSPGGDGTLQMQITTNNDTIKQMIADCSQYYGSYGMVVQDGTGTPGFIAAPVKEKKKKE